MSIDTFYVYEHWRPDKGECFYVGKGKKNRALYLKQRNKHHAAIQAKLARQGLCVEIKIISHGLTEEEAFNLETKQILFWRADGADLANRTLGGGGISGLVHTKETRKKMSVSQKKRSPRPPHSMEVRAKISRAQMGQKRRLGIPQSDKTKKILADLGRKNFEIFKKYMSMGPAASSKRVVCVNDNLSFESASAAARHYGVAKSSVIELCLGKKHRKTVGGKVFKYEEA